MDHFDDHFLNESPLRHQFRRRTQVLRSGSGAGGLSYTRSRWSKNRFTPTIRYACTCAKWARFRCSRAKAKWTWRAAWSAASCACRRPSAARRWCNWWWSNPAEQLKKGVEELDNLVDLGDLEEGTLADTKRRGELKQLFASRPGKPEFLKEAPRSIVSGTTSPRLSLRRLEDRRVLNGSPINMGITISDAKGAVIVDATQAEGTGGST